VLGYSSFDAGLALTAGGIATLIVVPIAGRLVGVVDVRILLGTGLLIQAGALWNMTHLSADISFWDSAFARLYQAAGLPLLFIPINAVAYAGLKPSQTAQASALLNVARNLGGTVGISSAQVLFAGAIQRHQAELVEPLNPIDPNYNQWIADAGRIFGGQGDMMTPLAVLYRQVQQQAAMLGFLDVFRTLMIVVLVVVPLVLLMRPGRQQSGGMGH
jgi:MFS transporter, DHA2 family, multidrug resistance protein